MGMKDRLVVACELNGFLEAVGSSDRLTEDDPRLTDDICSRCEFWMDGEDDEMDEEDRTLEVQLMLQDLGLLLPDQVEA